MQMMSRQRLLSMEFALPVFFLILTTIYLAAAFAIRAQISEPFWQGPRAIPIVASVMMYALLLFVLVRQFRTSNAKSQPGEILRPVWVMVATGVYIYVFEPLGYGLSTLLYVFALFFIFEFRTRQRLAFVIYALVVTAVFYILYAVIFGVRLPELFGVI
ncbi:hypothetical protein GL286_17020 [Paracoccus aestuariivivens]|uniref:DUF1468 domain-containing protein n=2 Tax=Paracoccus aestuariivivens TaxID=1820333 RepID=A0A6L6JHQ9_9RHOB|nr:hypothetical protein [Paracoccus aestuariivivens]